MTNVNETPAVLNLSNNNIPENQPAGTAVGTFSTTDPDAGNTFTYTLVPGAGSTDNSSFTIVGSTLQTNASFNFEGQTSYLVRIRTTDQGTLFTEQAFTINVTNVNETPAVLNLSATTIAENVLSHGYGGGHPQHDGSRCRQHLHLYLGGWDRFS